MLIVFYDKCQVSLQFSILKEEIMLTEEAFHQLYLPLFSFSLLEHFLPIDTENIMKSIRKEDMELDFYGPQRKCLMEEECLNKVQKIRKLTNEPSAVICMYPKGEIGIIYFISFHIRLINMSNECRSL